MDCGGVISEAASSVAQRRLFCPFSLRLFFSPDVNILTVQCFLAKQSVQLQTQSARLAQLNVFASLGIKKKKEIKEF